MRYIISVSLLLAAVCTLSPAARATPSLVGDYRVKGINPDGKSGYTGTVNISKDGDTFHLKWEVTPNTYIGSGFLRGNYLAVAYTDTKGTWFGVMLYEIKEDGRILDGKWSLAGSKRVSVELLTRQ